MNDWSDEETDEPLLADHRNFYKVEQCTRDGQRVARMLFAGNSSTQASGRPALLVGAAKLAFAAVK